MPSLEAATGISHSSATAGEEGEHVMSISSPSFTTRSVSGMVRVRPIGKGRENVIVVVTAIVVAIFLMVHSFYIGSKGTKLWKLGP